MDKYIFLAANGADGFCSHFKDCYNPYGGWKAYLIKGGAGSGKSSLMRYMGNRAKEMGKEVIFCPCTSDPHSLDAIIIEDIKTVFIDATAPHTVEPVLAGVCEQIFDTGAFWNKEKLSENGDAIIELFAKNKFYHSTASRYLSASGQLLKDNLRIVSTVTDFKKVNVFCDKMIKKYLKQKKKGGRLHECFLTAVTPEGIKSFPETVTDNFNEIVVLDDRYGVASNAILKSFCAAAVASGYTVIAAKNPILPESITEHILIPELSLAIVTENGYINFNTEQRRIHCLRFMKKPLLKGIRNRAFFNRRIAKELVLSAVQSLKTAKSVHDEIEKYYVDAMNFDAFWKKVKLLADEVIK